MSQKCKFALRNSCRNDKLLDFDMVAGYNHFTKGEKILTSGEKIATLRKQRGMSQEDLAAMMNVTRQAVSRWEQDEGMPDIENIVGLSQIFGVTTDFLLKNGESTAVRAPKDHAFAPASHPPKQSGLWLYHKFFNTGFIYAAGTGLYLILGFGFYLWHPGWMIFVALGITHWGLSAWFDDDDDDD